MSTTTDYYARYEIGLEQFLNRLPTKHRSDAGVHTLAHRLLENLAMVRRYGETPLTLAARNEVIEQLNRLALELLGKPFHDLCPEESFCRARDEKPCERGRTRIELTLGLDLAAIDPDKRQAAIAAALAVFAALLEISPEEIGVQEVRLGSTILRVEMPSESVKRLLALYECDDPILRTLNIERIRVRYSEEMISDYRNRHVSIQSIIGKPPGDIPRTGGGARRMSHPERETREGLEDLLRRFRRESNESGELRDHRRKRFFVSKSESLRERQRKADRRCRYRRRFRRESNESGELRDHRRKRFFVSRGGSLQEKQRKADRRCRYREMHMQRIRERESREQ